MLSSLSLFVATAEQTIVSRKRTWVQWGKGLTLEEYLERETIGETEEFGRGGKLTTWVLAPRDDPTTLDFFSSCRTFKRQVAICYPTQPKAKLELVFGYAIAAVLTPPQHRGRGYARHMMRLLHWVLAREEFLTMRMFPEKEWGERPRRVEGVGDGILSALSSDLGPKFYAECGIGVPSHGENEDGWVVRDHVSTMWKMQDGMLPEMEMEREVMWLDEGMAEETWNEDAERIKEELRESANKESRSQFSFLPNEGVAAYQWHRPHYHFSRYVHDAPKYSGVRIGTDGQTFATWTFEYQPGSPRTLIVTRLRADEGTVQQLMKNVLGYAQQHGMEKVEVWNLGEELEPLVGGERVLREHHLMSVKMYCGERDVVWRNNERSVYVNIKVDVFSDS